MAYPPPTTTTPRKEPVMKNPQCTHITMTRLYTTKFPCSMCGRMSSTGYLYRCTQDRELLIEDDLEREYSKSIFDPLGSLFPAPVARPRGPAARSNPLSLLSETQDISQYTPEQIEILLAQRRNVLKVAAEQSGALYEPSDDEAFLSEVDDKSPWTPNPDDECQFKVCPRCRPNYADRAYLSLDGIANDDLPATAITGFGFHLQGARPVSLVKDILGSRSHPLSGAGPGTSPPDSRNSIFGGTRAPKPPADHPPPPGLCGPLSPSSSTGTQLVPELPHKYDRNHWQNIRSEPHDAFGPWTVRAMNTPVGMLPADLRPILAPLPPQSSDEFDTATNSALTAMEADERARSFGSEPLEVLDGVAVTEEAVGLHVADLVTQF